jgi:sugar/nucleoside kinase (ribokinase family)
MVRKLADAVSLGEIMVESIFQTKSAPPINSTIVAKSNEKDLVLGGAAINVCWYLSLLGRSVRLVAPISNRHTKPLSKELSSSLIDLSHLIRSNGETDHIITILSPEGHRSIYTLGKIPSDLKRTLLSQSRTSKIVILNGGRHEEVRRAFMDAVNGYADRLVAFNPSYAIYEYAPRELVEILKKCDVCFLNEDEYRFAKKCSKNESIEDMPRDAFVVTTSSKGAWMVSNNRHYKYESIVNRKGVFLGAGDGCLAGFLSGLLDELPPDQALQRGLRLAALVVKRGSIRTKISRAERLSILRVE